MNDPTTATLADRIPAGTEPDQVADLFIDWTTEQNLELYPAQEEAILEILGAATSSWPPPPDRVSHWSPPQPMRRRWPVANAASTPRRSRPW